MAKGNSKQSNGSGLICCCSDGVSPSFERAVTDRRYRDCKDVLGRVIAGIWGLAGWWLTLAED